MGFGVDDILYGRDLTCIRGGRPVFSDLDFDLAPGRAMILCGANGSGKSSLIKIVAGLLPAERGEISFGAENILGNRDWISHNLCYLAHRNGLKPEMTVAENLAFWAQMDQSDKNNSDDIRRQATRIAIDHCLDLPVCYLSSGQARRAALARILCHPGHVWLLDEPTVGLDSEAVQMLARLMNDHLRRGGRIIAATHIELGLDPDKSDELNMSDFACQVPVYQEDGESLLC